MTPTHWPALPLLPSESSQASRETLPALPRFVRELVAISLEDEVVVDGGRELHVLRGEATRDLLTTLVELADGTRTPGQIAASIPRVPAEHVLIVLSFLCGLGLVEEGAVQETNSAVAHPETLAFLRRCIGATHSSRSGLQAYERLQASEVLLLDSHSNSSAVESMKLLLAQSGVGCVTVIDRESLDRRLLPSDASAGQTLLVYLSVGGEDCASAHSLDDWCSKSKISWLRAVLDVNRNYADLGPMFNRKYGPCYRCFCEMHGKSSFSGTTHPAGDVASTVIHSWVSQVAVEAIYFLGGIVPLVTTGKDFRRFDLKQDKSMKLACVRVPGCLICRPLIPGVGAGADPTFPLDTTVVFEDVVGLLSRNVAGASAEGETTFKPAFMRPPKRLPNSRRNALPHPKSLLDIRILDALDRDHLTPGKALTVDELSTILMMTAGVRERAPGRIMTQRWAATAGNLGSVELFVAVNHVEGMESGLYFYQSEDHSLFRFQRHVENQSVKDFVSRAWAFKDDDPPQALVLFTGAFHRVALKYGPFGYRLTYLDAGAAMSQLHLVARALNICSQTAVRWADDLIEEALNLEQFHEQVTGVVAFSSGTGGSMSGTTASPELRAGAPVSARTARTFSEMPSEALLELLHHDSRTGEKDLCLSAFPVSSVFLADHRNNSPSIRLPLPTHGGRPVSEVLAGRRSVREYTKDSVSIEQLSTMLNYAHMGDVHEWPEEHRHGLPLTFLALAGRVNGLAPFVYRYDSATHSLVRFAAAPSDDERVELFVQAEFASAPLCTWVVGNLAGACARHGAFGHRQLLLRAGAAGHRMWMSALAAGLSGCLVAGVIPGAARRYIGIDGYRQASLLAFAAGHELQHSGLPVVRTDRIGQTRPQPEAR